MTARKRRLVVPAGKPTGEWTVAQIDAYAAREKISDYKRAGTKSERLQRIADAEPPDTKSSATKIAETAKLLGAKKRALAVALMNNGDVPAGEIRSVHRLEQELEALRLFEEARDLTRRPDARP